MHTTMICGVGLPTVLISDNRIETHLPVKHYSLLGTEFFLVELQYKHMYLIMREYGRPTDISHAAMVLTFLK